MDANLTVLLSADPGEWMRLATEALNPAEDESETLRCEYCPATDPDDFTAFEAGETWGDQICDECLYEHAATRQSDRANADAYYCR